MPAGRRGHKIREYQRRIDALLEEERGSREPVPPPINTQHAALRKRMEEAHQVLLDAENFDEDDEDFDPFVGMLNNPEVRLATVRWFQMFDEEQRLLVAHGVNRRPYQPD